jgi:hypothetical protein
VSGLDHQAIRDLLAAHALDAVDPEEAAVIEAHVTTCVRCRSDLAGFREVIGLVANSGGDAPARLWQTISARIERSPVAGAQPGPRRVLFSAPSSAPAPSSPAPGGKFRRTKPWVLTAVAAALVVIAALGVQLGRLENQVSHLQAVSSQQVIAQAAQSALSDPQARRITLDAAHSSGPPLAQIAILPSGAAFFLNHRLPPLSSAQTYQLWGKVGDVLVSLGLLGPGPRDVAFYVDPSAPIAVFAVTAERAGGVVQSAHVPVAVSPAA